MKIETEPVKKQFEPIKIIIENEEEAIALYASLNAPIDDRLKHVYYEDDRKILQKILLSYLDTNALKNELNRQQINTFGG